MRLQQTDIDRIEVERNHREEGETEESSKLVLEGLLDEGQVLEADAVGALDVDTRLVGGDVALVKRQVLHAALCLTIAERIRTLMNVQAEADAMAGAVVVVQALTPEHLARCKVQGDAGRALQEDHVAEAKHGLQHEGEVLPLDLRDRAHRDGTGDVGGTLEVLSAGIEEVEPLRLDYAEALRCRCIVWQCRIRTIGRNCREARLDIAVLLAAVALRQLRGVPLVYLLTAEQLLRLLCELSIRSECVLHEVHEVRDGDAILHMRSLHVLDLHRILLRLPHGSREHLIEDTYRIWKLADRRVVRLRALEQDRGVLQLMHRLIEAVVWSDLYLKVLKIGLHFLIEVSRIHEEVGTLRIDDHIGKEDWIARDVIGTKVQEPCDVVETRDDMETGTLLLHQCTKLRELFCGALAGEAILEDPYTGAREGRTVRPDLTDEILLCLHRDRLLRKTILQGHAMMEIDTAAIEAEIATLRGHGNEIIIERRHPRLAHTHQLHIPTGQLLLRLDEITTIRKKSGAVLRHHQISLTGKTGQEADRTEIHTDILAQVKIIRRYQIGIDVILFHLLTQRVQCYIHFYNSF